MYNGIFDYLRAVVYNLYKSIFSTGAAMVQKQNVIKVLLPIEIQLTDTAFYQHAPFMPMVGVGKESAYINWSMVTCKMAAPVTGTTLRTTGPVLADSR